MGWKDTIQDAPKSSWRDTITDEPSMAESGLRGAAQGASFGFEDELAGLGGAVADQLMPKQGEKLEANNPELQAKLDAVVPKDRTFGESYEHARDEERGLNAKAEKQNPKTYFASGLAGAVANPISRVASTLKGAVGTGALQGLGGSDEDLSEEKLPDLAKDVAMGAAFGAGGYGVGKAIPKAAQAVGWAGKKALTNFGPSAEAIEARLAGKAQDSAKSFSKLAEDMAGTVKGLGKRTKDMSDAAVDVLTAEQNIPKQTVTSVLDDAIGGIGVQGKAIGPVEKRTQAVLNELKNDLDQLDDNVSEKDLKAIIKKMDDNINWDDQTAQPLNRSLQKIRTAIDQSLKFRNPAYKQAMKPVSNQTRLIEVLKRKFNLQGEPGVSLDKTPNLVPTDTTATKIQTALRENKDVTERELRKLAELTGKDYSALAKDYQLSKQFQVKSPSASSKKTNIGGAAGAGVGALLGGPLGAAGGAAVGASAGGAMDAFGGKVAAKLIDSYVKAGNTAAFGKFKPAIDAAVKKGPEALAILGAMLSKDPEFRKQVGVQK